MATHTSQLHPNVLMRPPQVNSITVHNIFSCYFSTLESVKALAHSAANIMPKGDGTSVAFTNFKIILFKGA